LLQVRLRSFLPLSGSNVTRDVVVKDGIIYPPASNYIQRWGELAFLITIIMITAFFL
jgi:hypothetical protein